MTMWQYHIGTKSSLCMDQSKKERDDVLEAQKDDHSQKDRDNEASSIKKTRLLKRKRHVNTRKED